MAKALGPPPAGWPLARAAEGLGVVVPEDARKALVSWLDLLVTWNARVDLTAARSADELVDLMLADALILSTRIPEGARVVDVGTGAGAPGLALAVLRADLEVTLVEPLAKRAAFLRTVLVALARATLAPAPWLTLARDLVKDGGTAWVFLAKETNPTNPGFTFVEELPYVWPLTTASRRLVRYERREGVRPGR